MTLKQELQKILQGDVQDSPAILDKYSRDASLFEVRPQLVVFPKNSQDICRLVKFVNKYNRGQLLSVKSQLSLTARSAGTDMTGGPLTESIVLDFTKYFNKIKKISPKNKTAVVQPGVYFRDFDKATRRHDLILPSYPASREICALGGMVANNSGGEKTLIYGKTENYVEELRVVLSDGNEYLIKPLDQAALAKKLKLNTLEGQIYRRLHQLIAENSKLIRNAKPAVSKNSSGYPLWNILNEKFNLSQLFVGSQGTLGIVTEIKLRLIHPKKYSKLLVITLRDLKILAQIVNQVLKHQPESFESFDDNTLRLGIRYMFWRFSWQFLPEFWLIVKSGLRLPKLVLIAEFTGDSPEEALAKAQKARAALQKFHLATRVTTTEQDKEKYWAIRRESFNLLRQKIKDKKTAPFIDDIIVQPKHLPQFLPKLNKILRPYKITYTIAGHIGNGNFHIIPLMNLADEKQRQIIPELSKKVYRLVFQFRGSMSAEHNDGLIRSPFVKQMFGPKFYRLMEQVKTIMDPQNIFNPGKKVGGDLRYAIAHLKKK